MIPGPINGPMLPTTEAQRLVSPWMTMLHTGAGDAMLAGFTTARDQMGVIAIQAARAGIASPPRPISKGLRWRRV